MSKPSKKKAKRERRERRFFPQSTMQPTLVYAAGGVGALLLGAGAWEQMGRTLLANPPDARPYATYILAAGAVVSAVAIWLGTSGEPPLRVGDAGIGSERGGVARIPWHALTALRWNAESNGLVAEGTDENGKPSTIRLSLASQPQACAWALKEARERVPSVVDVPAAVAAEFPDPRSEGGDVVALEPIQIVGKRCAASGKIIAYEPDARVCPRCERVYHKDHAPAVCACGGAMARAVGGSPAASEDAPPVDHASS